jgi:hypothetical protein
MEINMALIEAQNKTTHAIRGLLSTLLVYLVGSILTVVAIIIGSAQKVVCVGNSLSFNGSGCGSARTNGNFAFGIAGLIGIVMLVVVIVVIVSALKKSEPTDWTNQVPPL